jgi:hypothetical protein
MKNDFQLLRLMVDELNSTNSTNDKRDILSKYDDEFIKKVIYYTYNPTFQYYVTPDNLEKNYSNDLGKVVKYSDLFELLDALKSRSITGHLAINSVNDFCYDNEKYKDLIYKVIGKDLEIRMGDSLINKVFPGLIPTFDCALATDFDKVQVDFAKDTFFASRKLDGVRCLAVVDARIDELAKLINIIRDYENPFQYVTFMDSDTSKQITMEITPGILTIPNDVIQSQINRFGDKSNVVQAILSKYSILDNGKNILRVKRKTRKEIQGLEKEITQDI